MVHFHNQRYKLFEQRRYFCFGGGGSSSIPAPASAPVTAPPPSPTASFSPSEETTQRSTQEKRRRIAALRYGMVSTIKTGGEGLTTQPNLLLPMAIGAKTKLGQ